MIRTIAELAQLVENLQHSVDKIPDKTLSTDTEVADILDTISGILADMDDTIRSLDNMMKLTSIASQPEFIDQLQQLDGLKSNILTAVKVMPLPKKYKKTWGVLKTKICTSSEEREEYRHHLVQNNQWEKEIQHRSYIQQKFLGIAETLVMKEMNIAFLSTHGISPCVGYILFSKTRNICILAHVDDEFDITAARSVPQPIQAKAAQYYQNFTRQILEAVGVEEDDNWSATLIVSGHPQSQALSDHLVSGLKAVNIEPDVKQTVPWDTNVSINLQDLRLKNYKERVPFNELLPNKLTLREAFNLPEKGLSLYRMERTGLVLQDLDASYVYSNGQVLSRPALIQALNQTEHTKEQSTPTNDSPSLFSTAGIFRSFKGCYDSMVRCCYDTKSNDVSQEDLVRDKEELDPLLGHKSNKK